MATRCAQVVWRGKIEQINHYIGEHLERENTEGSSEQMPGKQNRKLDGIRKPTMLDIAWAAGIYEGEGTCAYKETIKKQKGKEYLGYSEYLAVVQKDPEILYRLRDLFGGSVYGYNNGRVDFFRWTIHGQRMRTFAGMIYSYLSARRKLQLDVVLTHRSPVETACGSPSQGKKIQSELHGDVQSEAETTSPLLN